MLATTHPSLDAAIAVFIAGHVAGAVVFGVALLRSRSVPAWVGWAMLISQPLHVVAFVLLGSPALDLAGWGLTAVAMVARALLARRIQPAG